MRQSTYITGRKGLNRVRLFAHPTTGTLYLEFYENRMRARQRLPHMDWNRAQRQADELAAALAEPGRRRAQGITLGALFDIYGREVTVTKSASAAGHDRRASRVILDVLGASRRAEDLTHRDAMHFIRERQRRGDLRKNGARGRPVRTRAIEQDLKFFKAALNWAVGAGWLDRNPFHQFRIPTERSPRRPVVTDGEYQAMLAAAEDVHPSCRLAVLLGHETGHRGASLRGLLWSDVNLEDGAIRWRAKHDKQGREHTTLLSEVALSALREARRLVAAVGDVPVITADGATPVSRNVMQIWWRRLEEAAGIPHQPGRGWHSLRRQFASELKHVPLVDLAQMMGSRDTRTILTCYTQPDADTQRAAMASRVPLRALG